MTNNKLDTAAAVTCNESVFSFGAEQKEVNDLKAEVEKLKALLAKKEKVIEFRDQEIEQLRAQLKQALE